MSNEVARCRATSNGVRCDCFAGHPSYHASRTGDQVTEWRDGQPAKTRSAHTQAVNA